MDTALRRPRRVRRAGPGTPARGAGLAATVPHAHHLSVERRTAGWPPVAVTAVRVSWRHIGVDAAVRSSSARVAAGVGVPVVDVSGTGGRRA